MNPFFKAWKEAIDIIGGRPVVFTNGCFDLFHAGHAHLLYNCSQMTGLTGSVVVGLNSDRSIRRLKGESRPLNDLIARKMVLRSCKWVNLVIPFDEDTPETLIKLIQPDVLVKDASYAGKPIIGADFVKKKGGKVVLVDTFVGVSTTVIICKVDRREGVKLEPLIKYRESGSRVFTGPKRSHNNKRKDLSIKQSKTHLAKRMKSRAKTVEEQKKRRGTCQHTLVKAAIESNARYRARKKEKEKKAKDSTS